MTRQQNKPGHGHQHRVGLLLILLILAAGGGGEIAQVVFSASSAPPVVGPTDNHEMSVLHIACRRRPIQISVLHIICTVCSCGSSDASGLDISR